MLVTIKRLLTMMTKYITSSSLAGSCSRTNMAERLEGRTACGRACAVTATHLNNLINFAIVERLRL